MEKCFICGSTKIRSENHVVPKTMQDLHIVLCQECAHGVRSDHRDYQENIQIQKEYYNKNANRMKKRPRWPNRLALILSQIEKLTGKSGKVLDIGCSTGYWLSVFGVGWERYGVELSDLSAQIARDYARANVFCGSIEDFNAEPNSFDLITAFALIEHLKDPKILTNRVYELLKQGGIFVVGTGDRQSEVARQLGYNWPLYWPNEHMHFFSDQSLEYLLIQSGFTIIRREWRYMRNPGENIFSQFYAKAKEIVGLVSTPIYDHLYIYAEKPVLSSAHV